MGGGDNGCGSGFLGVTSNNIPQMEQHSPFGLMLLHLGNVTIICIALLGFASTWVCIYLGLHSSTWVCIYLGLHSSTWVCIA